MKSRKMISTSARKTNSTPLDFIIFSLSYDGLDGCALTGKYCAVRWCGDHPREVQREETDKERSGMRKTKKKEIRNRRMQKKKKKKKKRGRRKRKKKNI